MKSSVLYQTLGCLLLASLGHGQASPARPVPVVLDDAIRAAHPGRLWAADYNGTVPDTASKWALTNDFGALPEYWIAEDDADLAGPPPVEKLAGRDMATWVIAFSWVDCHDADQMGWMLRPTQKTCYGLWSNSRGEGRSMWISSRTSQVNAYVDPACSRFSFVIRNYYGCKNNINIRSVWMRG